MSAPRQQQAAPASPAVVRAEPKPALTLAVIVRTAEKIGGQNDHAAIITRVIDDDLIDVMIMPAGGQPYPIAAVYHMRHAAGRSLNWRWPNRNPEI